MARKRVAQYQALTRRIPGLANSIITEVVLFPAFDPTVTKNPPQGYQTTALWDTGATGSVIIATTAQAMNLVPSGMTDMAHAGGTNPTNTYILNIGLPNKRKHNSCRLSKL